MELEILNNSIICGDIRPKIVQNDDLRKAFAGLTDKQSRRLLMRVIGGYPYGRIAKLEATSKEAIRRSVKRAAHRLKRYILFRQKLKKDKVKHAVDQKG